RLVILSDLVNVLCVPGVVQRHHSFCVFHCGLPPLRRQYMATTSPPHQDGGRLLHWLTLCYRALSSPFVGCRIGCCSPISPTPPHSPSASATPPSARRPASSTPPSVPSSASTLAHPSKASSSATASS